MTEFTHLRVLEIVQVFALRGHVGYMQHLLTQVL